MSGPPPRLPQLCRNRRCDICAACDWWCKMGRMAVHYRTSDGCWSVEVVRLTGTPNKHDGEWIRVRNFGFFVADVRTVTELQSYGRAEAASQVPPDLAGAMRPTVAGM